MSGRISFDHMQSRWMKWVLAAAVIVFLAVGNSVGFISTLARYLLDASLLSLLFAALCRDAGPFLLFRGREGTEGGGVWHRRISWRTLLVVVALSFALSSLFAELDVRPVFRTADFTATSELGRETAKLGIDGDVNTGWSSGLPRRKGNFFQVDFHRVIPLRKIVFLYGGSPWDFPWEYRIYALNEAGEWEEVAYGSKDISPVEVTVRPVRARAFRIVGADEDPSRVWRIDEIKIYPKMPYGKLSGYFVIAAVLAIFVLLTLAVTREGVDGRVDVRVAAILLVIVLAGFSLRSYHLLQRGVGLDEREYLHLGGVPVNEDGGAVAGSDLEWLNKRWNTSHDLVPILRTLLPRFIYRAVPSPALAVRLTSVILGTLTIFLVFVLWRDLGESRRPPYEALLAAAILTVQTLHLDMSRRGYSHLPMSFFFVLHLYIFYLVWEGRRGRSLYCVGTLALFLGYLFHPLMVLAPACILLYLIGAAARDLATRGRRLSRIMRGAVPYLLSLLPFALYVFYTLGMKGGMVGVEAGETNIDLASQSSILAGLLQFVEGRGYIVYLNSQQLFTYGGLFQFFSVPELAVAGLGVASILVRRVSGEVFLLSQMVFFSLIVFLIWHSSFFLKHYPPAVVLMSCMTARGALMISSRLSRLTRRCRLLLAAIPIISLLLIMFFLSFNMIFKGLGH